MRPFTPELAKLPKATILTATTVGTPNVTAQSAIGRLYSTAYGTKFNVYRPKGKKMEIGCLACEWPNAHKAPKSKWIGHWLLEVSSFVTKSALLQKDPKQPVRLAKRPAGTYAQILHVGPYSAEGSTVKKLHAFIKEKGYAIAGPHEEVYLTRPNVKAPKTIIRYAVKKSKVNPRFSPIQSGRGQKSK